MSALAYHMPLFSLSLHLLSSKMKRLYNHWIYAVKLLHSLFQEKRQALRSSGLSQGHMVG